MFQKGEFLNGRSTNISNRLQRIFCSANIMLCLQSQAKCASRSKIYSNFNNETSISISTGTQTILAEVYRDFSQYREESEANIFN
jgi:hypothetical protein